MILYDHKKYYFSPLSIPAKIANPKIIAKGFPVSKLTLNEVMTNKITKHINITRHPLLLFEGGLGFRLASFHPIDQLP